MTTNTKQMPELLDQLVHAIYAKLQGEVADKQVPPAVVLINSRAKAVEQLPMMMDSVQGKDLTAAYVKAAAEIMGADAAVMISEVWAIVVDSQEEREALRQKYGDSLEHYPEAIRRDALAIMAETREQTWHCEALFIPATFVQPRQLGPLVIKAVDASQGRFGRFLPR